MSAVIERDKKYIAGTYNRFPISIVGGKGSVVFDENGKRYIDMGSGIGVTSFGIADDEWVDAVTKQLNAVQHMSNLYYTSPCSELAQLLCDRTGFKKVFFSNSGAEANECAIKVARKYTEDKYGDKSAVIVTLANSFHGRTITTLAATGQDHYHELFQPLTKGFCHIDAGTELYELEAVAAHSRIAAVMIECVQGEGGVNAIDRSFAKQLSEFCHNRDILLIVDEVQTGNGRTGKLYSYMNYGIEPDIVTTAKGLGGGLPIGAVLLGDKVENTLGFGDHGSTFGGNPVACAGAISIMNRLDEAFLNSVEEKGKMIFEALNGADGIESVSGMGLMIGIKTVKPAAEIIKACMEKGVLCLTAKDKVRLLPALNIPNDVLAEAIEIIKAVCAE